MASAQAPALRQKADNAPAPQPQREPTNPRIATILNTLKANKAKIEAALGKALSAERVIQIVGIIAYKTPDLQQCEASSILAAIIRASTLRLDLEPSAMEAYLIPRWNSVARVMECNFQVGYQGVRKLVYRTNKVTAFETRLVYANEAFEICYTPSLQLLHKPLFDEDKRGDLIGGYGYGRIGAGDPFISYMTKKEILSLKARGKGTQPAWATDFEQMCHKTLVIRLAKQFPKNQELIDVFRDEYRLNGPDFDAEQHGNARKLGSAGLLERLKGGDEEPTFEASQGVPNPVYSEADDEPEGTFPIDAEAQAAKPKGSQNG